MKYLYFFCFVILISGCNRTKFVEFTGTMPGINNGAFVIKDDQGTPIVSETIFNGKFHTKTILQHPGYYDLYITGDMEKDSKKNVYDVYLEGGVYTIEAEADKLYLYPTIKGESKKQNELSEFYSVASAKLHDADLNVKTLYGLLYDKDSPAVAAGTAGALPDQLADAQAKWAAVQAEVLEDFVTKYPQNDVAAHILSQIDYHKDPVSYNKAYQKFSADQKNTVDGKNEGDELKQLMLLAPGALAPKLAGKTPDGKAFDPKSINKKIILVEFWRSDIEASRVNHKDLVGSYYSPIKNKDFTVVSVSLDTLQTAWTAALKEDEMSWTQISDLKGNSSPNMTNWAVGAIPTYDLLDGNWHFIKRDIDFGKIPTEVAKYLKTTVASQRIN